jgi:hypothetical protein
MQTGDLTDEWGMAVFPLFQDVDYQQVLGAVTARSVAGDQFPPAPGMLVAAVRQQDGVGEPSQSAIQSAIQWALHTQAHKDWPVWPGDLREIDRVAAERWIRTRGGWRTICESEWSDQQQRGLPFQVNQICLEITAQQAAGTLQIDAPRQGDLRRGDLRQIGESDA